MKAEVIREIARKGARHEGEYMNASAIIDMALPILEKAGFVVLPKEELEAALKPFAPIEDVEFIPDDSSVVLNVMVTGITYMFPAFKWGDLRRAAALLAALTQEKT